MDGAQKFMHTGKHYQLSHSRSLLTKYCSRKLVWVVLGLHEPPCLERGGSGRGWMGRDNTGEPQVWATAVSKPRSVPAEARERQVPGPLPTDLTLPRALVYVSAPISHAQSQRPHRFRLPLQQITAKTLLLRRRSERRPSCTMTNRSVG